MKVLRCLSVCLSVCLVWHEGSTLPNRKHRKRIAGKRLNLGVRGPGEKASWGETRSSGTGGSHPGHLISSRG